MMASRPRILYIGMVSTEAYCEAINAHMFIGAASAKMSSIVLALRSVGQSSALISLPPLHGHDLSQMIYPVVTRRDGFPAAFFPVARTAVIRKLLGAIALASFAAKTVRPNDRVIFYNHAIEYALALLTLKLRRINTYHDIEDAPTRDDVGVRGVLSRVAFKITYNLTSSRKIVVSDVLARSMGLDNYIAVRGIAATDTYNNTGEGNAEKWQALRDGEALRVHYGGTLIASTGVELFCRTVELLATHDTSLKRPIQFIVTGVGEIDRIQRLAETLKQGKVEVIVYGSIDRGKYFDLLRSCHASMSLKSPHEMIAETTFPSKVIEVTSRGLALVSTVISDVPEIFTERSAYLLREYDCTKLAGILRGMAEHPEDVIRTAAAGEAVARTQFSSKQIGQLLIEFILDGQGG